MVERPWAVAERRNRAGSQRLTWLQANLMLCFRGPAASLSQSMVSGQSVLETLAPAIMMPQPYLQHRCISPLFTKGPSGLFDSLAAASTDPIEGNDQ